MCMVGLGTDEAARGYNRGAEAAPKILLVDDDAAIRESFADVLNEDGYAVTTAANGLEALEYLHSAQTLPSLILLDIMMPKMNGWQFRAAQQVQQRLADIPVVVLSASGNLDQVAAKMGVAGFLRKPIDLIDLLAVLQRHCGLRPPPPPAAL